MNKNLIPLNLLPMGQLGKVGELIAGGSTRRRLLDLGLIYGTEVEALRKSPSGDPIAYQILTTRSLKKRLSSFKQR